MLIELKKEDYGKVINIINRDYIGVEPQSVLTGENPGFVCSDSAENPSMAMVFHQGEGGFFFLGDFRNTILNRAVPGFIDDTLKNRLATMGIGSFEFSGDSPGWSAVFRNIFGDRALTQSYQRIFSLKEESRPTSGGLDASYRIRKIDRDLYSDKSIENLSFVAETVDSWWGSADNFFRHSSGYVALSGSEIAGRCLVDGKYGLLKAMGIETSEAHRKKGVATALATAVLNDILDGGFYPYWECMDTNELSKKVAARIGLSPQFSYELFSFPL